jgi:heat shock protein HslJ
MTDDPSAGQDDTPADAPEVMPQGPPVKMNLGFYAALLLIGILVLMVVVLNYPAAKANAGILMTKTNWTLASLADSTGILIPAQSGTGVTAQFDREGRMNGNTGCNGYAATYQTHDYSINISGISQTKMFCHGPGVMEQEMAFLADLPKVSSFRVSESTLKCYDAAGKTVLVFVPG